MSSSSSTVRGVCAKEMDKFRVLQGQWWNPHGPLRSLHLFNPMRVQYISGALLNYGKGMNHAAGSAGAPTHTHGRAGTPFLSPSLSVLDVGCGGGILSESLARLGASVTGIDMCEESVMVAEQRRQEAAASLTAEWAKHLTYKATSLFDVVEGKESARPLKRAYDLVVASEVIEHVSDARGFLTALCQATKPGGLLVLSTMDKTVQTYISHIVLAEQLTGVVTPGTHDWAKFVPPGDMTKFCARPGNDVTNVDLQYILTYPDICQSIASRNFEINFSLSKCVNTGHYFWAGVKAPKPTAAAEDDDKSMD